MVQPRRGKLFRCQKGQKCDTGSNGGKRESDEKVEDCESIFQSHFRDCPDIESAPREIQNSKIKVDIPPEGFTAQSQFHLKRVFKLATWVGEFIDKHARWRIVGRVESPGTNEETLYGA